MGLFGNLFEKKQCSICGNEIGLLGNRKLEDGNLCKECNAKLSPWFSERRSSTVGEIKAQLAYREDNKFAVTAFNCTRTLGESTKVLLDEDHKRFIVSSSSNWRNGNPDVLDYSMVTGCDIDIDESKSEIRKDGPENKKISYSPAQYNYDYNFYVTVHVNHPYFTQMRFRINSSSVDIDNNLVNEHGVIAPRGVSKQEGVTYADPMFAFVPDKENCYEYQKYLEVANEIKAALTGIRPEVRQESKAVNTSKVARVCPCCGATTIPDANNCCEYCGTAFTD